MSGAWLYIFRGDAVNDLEAWSEALRRAALPDASLVRFGRSSTPDGVSYSLNSYDGEGGVIGDERDYDLLKAVFMPLERLSAQMDGEFMLEMDLGSGAVAQVEPGAPR